MQQLDQSSDTDYVHLYYNNTAATDAQNATRVWDTGQKGVYQLSEDVSTAGAGEILDSTSNNNDGTGVCHCSYLRPIMGLRPKCRMASTGVPWQFPSDMSIICWLEQCGYEYDVKRLFGGFHSLLTSKPGSEPDTAGLGKLAVFSGVREYPMRVKCATLAWHAMHSALTEDGHSVTTE